jgi:hypothetical protein
MRAGRAGLLIAVDIQHPTRSYNRSASHFLRRVRVGAHLRVDRYSHSAPLICRHRPFEADSLGSNDANQLSEFFCGAR